MFKHQCGVLVRDNIPISVRDWLKRKGANEGDYVSDRSKDMLWNELMTHFTLPEPEDPADMEKLTKQVKSWTLKKMAELFRAWKKRLWSDYKSKKTPPVFEGYLAKQANHWNAFKAYKESQDAVDLSEKNKKNAKNKKYHHVMGPGGYEVAMPKWDKKEQELISKGIAPEPIREEWELRARNWFLGHGSTYDETTGDLLCPDGIRVPRQKWLEVVKEIREGTRKFIPDRENDLLTVALGNREKPGRARGLGPQHPWWNAFAKDMATYRSRSRAKRRREEEEQNKYSQLMSRIDNQQQQINELRGAVHGHAQDITAAAPSQRKSSVGDSEAPPAENTQLMIDGGPGYPVDGIKDTISCELHVQMKNISMKVAVGYAIPSTPDARWNEREIPAGYAKVGVDEVVPMFSDMLLDMPGPNDETTLGEVVGVTILWDKKYIKLPGTAPRTTPPPTRRSPTPPSPRSPLHEYDQHSVSPSRSPLPDLGEPSAPPPELVQPSAPPPPDQPSSPPPDLVRPSSPPPMPAKENRRKRTKQQCSPKRKMSPLPKVPHKNLPIRPYDRTEKENAAIAKAEKEAHFAKKPEPMPAVYTEKQIGWASGFVSTPRQYDLHQIGRASCRERVSSPV